VWHRRPYILWTRLAAVTFLTAGTPLLADDQTASSDGARTLMVDAGGKSLPIRVKDAANPYKNVSSSYTPGKYDPESPNFSATSSMANKSFSAPSDSVSKSNADSQSVFATKSYNFDPSSPSAPNLDTKAGVPTTSAYNRSDSDFDKSYATSRADADQNRRSLLASETSPDQGRTSTLGDETADTFASPLTSQVFRGDEADASHRSLNRMQNGQMLVTDLPNRPLTIDEVRALINHGFKPDTSVQPPSEEEQSKPLNDPNYKPEPLRETPPPATDDDKDDAVPPPGTMAAPPSPENSEPLPQP